MHDFGMFCICCMHFIITVLQPHIGGELNLICRYDTNRFLYSKKYWCRGNSRSTCTILLDSESKTQNTDRSYILDARRRGLILKVTNLQFEDSGDYWVGIDTISADTMTSVNCGRTASITASPVTTSAARRAMSSPCRFSCPLTAAASMSSLCLVSTDVRLYSHQSKK
uniref:Immunoglobulin V-set domain-containing protein n=1 Tax=Cyclopterus lumpus TaxID=8103 RepID=A0A8C2YXS4_CYCLU